MDERATNLAVEKRMKGDELEKACAWAAAKASNVAVVESCIVMVVMPTGSVALSASASVGGVDCG